MTHKHDKNKRPDPRVVREEDKKQASIIIQVVCAIGLAACIIVGQVQKVDISIFAYAIFGGGVLGVDNFVKLLKTVFRIGGDK